MFLTFRCTVLPLLVRLKNKTMSKTTILLEKLESGELTVEETEMEIAMVIRKEKAKGNIDLLGKIAFLIANTAFAAIGIWVCIKIIIS